MMARLKLKYEDYSLGWFSALEYEVAAGQAMLDEEHETLVSAAQDSNTYTLGRIGQHSIVIAGLPAGTTGTTAASTVATNLLRSFPNIKFGLMVGIGGGVLGAPSDEPDEDLRLGHVVVSYPTDRYGECRLRRLRCYELSRAIAGGVVQYDFGRTVREGKHVVTGSLNRPPASLMTGAGKLRGRH